MLLLPKPYVSYTVVMYVSVAARSSPSVVCSVAFSLEFAVIYVYTCIYIYIYTHIHIYTSKYIYIYIYIY